MRTVRSTRHIVGSTMRTAPAGALNRRARDNLDRAVERLARTPRLGTALCPSCHRYQSWMVRASWLAPIKKAFWPGALAGLVAGIVVGVLEIVGVAGAP